MSEIDALFKYNCSTLFMLFPLGLERKNLIKFGFKAAYVQDASIDDPFERAVFILFKPTDLTIFQAFVDSEYARVNHHTETFDLMDDYDHEGGHVVLLYQIPEVFRDDFDKFLDGKYSKFSNRFRSTYPKIIKIRHDNGRVDEVMGTAYKIINKDEETRREVLERGEIDVKGELEKYFDVIFTPEMELWQPPSLKNKDGSSGKDVLDIKQIMKDEQPPRKSNKRTKSEETDS